MTAHSSWSVSKLNSPHRSAVGLLVWGACLIGLCALICAQQALAMSLVEQVEQARSNPSGQQQQQQQQQLTATLAVVENPELVVRVLESLLRSILYSASASDYQQISGVAQKRGLDLGISRGFSGSQAGKHLMGLSAASFANGPGR